MKQLYLHVGAHKTASSLLQSILKTHAETLLEREGIHCVFRSEMLEMSFYRSMKRAGPACGGSLKPCEEDFESVSNMQELDHLVLTNEDLLSSLSPQRFFYRAGPAVAGAVPRFLPGP